jgi:hypothetical protein
MTGQPPDPAVLSSYENSRHDWVTKAWTVFFGALTLYGPVGLLIRLGADVHSASQAFEALPAFVLYILLFGGIWYLVLTQVTRLELTADTLRWRTRLRRHEVPLTELRRVRPKGGRSRAEVIEFARRRRITVGVRDGLEEFAADIKAAAPQVEVAFADRPSGHLPMA